jgi:hypothetical protein
MSTRERIYKRKADGDFEAYSGCVQLLPIAGRFFEVAFE